MNRVKSTVAIRTRVKDVSLSIQYGYTSSAIHSVKGPRLLRITDIQDGRVDWASVPSCSILAEQVHKYKLTAGDLVFARTGATTGKSFLIGDCPEAVFASYLIRVRVTSEVNPRFLAAFFQSPDYWQQIEAGKRGVGQPNVNGTILGEVSFPLPPLTEQRRIVAEIEQQLTRLDAAVAVLRRTQANLNRYRAAVLKAACEGRLVLTEVELSGVKPRVLGSIQSLKRGSTPRGGSTSEFESGALLLERILAERRQNKQGRNQYKEPAEPNTAKLPAPPNGWTWASVAQLTSDSMIGLDRGRPQQSKDPTARVPYIKMNNVTMDGRVLFDDMMFVPASKEEAANFAVQDGDILFNTRNSQELVGKVGLIRTPPTGAIYNNNLMRIRVSDGVNPAFMCLQMCSHGFRQRMELVKKATTNIAAVYGKDLWPLPIALPPLAEQTRIVAEVERRLSVVDELESVVIANLQRATRLRRSILKNVFDNLK